MISLLRGKIAEKSDRSLIIDVGGVGYGVTVPMSTFSDLPDTGTEVELKVHTHVTEKSFELFGFLTDSEKKLFQCLIGVSGVGPKLAITILSNIKPRDLISSVMAGNLAARKVPGIGPKMATKITAELKDKLPTLVTLEHGEQGAAVSSLMDDVKSMLEKLGFTRNEIDQNTVQLSEILDSSVSVEEKMKEALKIMKKG